MKLLKGPVKILISILALYFVFTKIDMPSFYNIMKHCKIMLLIPAGVFFIISKFFSAYRLNYFFRAIGAQISERNNIRLYLLGMFYNLFLPGGIGGDGYKIYYLNKKINTPVKKSFLAIIFDRLSGLLALGILCAIFTTCISIKIIPVVYTLSLALLGIIAYYLIVHYKCTLFYSSLNKTNLLALGTQAAQIISAFFIVKALGNEAHMFDYLLVFMISSIIAAVPFTVGGIGAREITFFYASKILNLTISTSIALSVLFFVITALVSLSGLIYVFRPNILTLNNNQ